MSTVAEYAAKKPEKRSKETRRAVSGNWFPTAISAAKSPIPDKFVSVRL